MKLGPVDITLRRLDPKSEDPAFDLLLDDKRPFTIQRSRRRSRPDGHQAACPRPRAGVSSGTAAARKSFHGSERSDARRVGAFSIVK
jgi:hypothetical protein